MSLIDRLTEVQDKHKLSNEASIRDLLRAIANDEGHTFDGPDLRLIHINQQKQRDRRCGGGSYNVT